MFSKNGYKIHNAKVSIFYIIKVSNFYSIIILIFMQIVLFIFCLIYNYKNIYL